VRVLSGCFLLLLCFGWGFGWAVGFVGGVICCGGVCFVCFLLSGRVFGFISCRWFLLGKVVVLVAVLVAV